jgi:tight adherence protein B
VEEATLTATFVSLLTVLAVVSAVAGVYSILSDLYLHDRTRVRQRVDAEFLKRQRDRARKLSLFKDPGQFAVEVAAHDHGDSSFRLRFEAMIEQSGLDLTPGRLLARAAAMGLALGILAVLLSQNPLAALVATPIGAAAPLLYVRRIRDARLEKLLGQLPDAFELMSRVVRAGQTIPQALQAVSDEFQPPLSSEFAFCYEQQNLGLTTEAALRDLSRRTGLLEIKIFVLALLVQQQTGGNLAELLDKLSTVIRERFQIRGQIRTLTAEGRSQATVLLVLPLVMFGFILLFNRDYANVLLARPQLVIGCLVSEGIGALWIRQIINFDF